MPRNVPNLMGRAQVMEWTERENEVVQIIEITLEEGS